MTTPIRACPLCSGASVGVSFPYAIRFSDQVFRYYRCGSCRTIFVDPVPDAATFALMYDKINYHDSYYSSPDLTPYAQAAALLAGYANPGSLVLDYGCGMGHFLKAVKAQGFVPFGVEFDKMAADSAAASVGCPVYTIANLRRVCSPQKFDVLHLGDVMEHLPDPYETLSGLLQLLKPGALVFVEGPLETNPSPVYWSARLFGWIKHRLRPGLVGMGVPTHLFRTSAKAQAAFFADRFPRLRLLEWQTSESGWPYAQAQGVKRRIAEVAIALGGREILGVPLGNRFRALYSMI